MLYAARGGLVRSKPVVARPEGWEAQEADSTACHKGKFIFVLYVVVSFEDKPIFTRT